MQCASLVSANLHVCLPRCRVTANAIHRSADSVSATSVAAVQPTAASVAGPQLAAEARCPTCTPRLLTSFHGHQAAVTDTVILRYEQGVREFVTASMDKTMKFWRVEEGAHGDPVISVQTIEDEMVFSLLKDEYAQDRPASLFCGTSNKDVVVWEAPASQIVDRGKVCLAGHTGWVKALAASGRWLFTCGCNHLRQWDLAWPLPREVNDVELFTGDIQCITTTPDAVFTVCSKGMLHKWSIDTTGGLDYQGNVSDAHADRALVVKAHGGMLYTAGMDGSLKAWSASDLELVKVIEDAHDGEKINCAAISQHGILYTGGADARIRAWSLPNLLPCCDPVEQHGAAVRALAAADSHLVSADADGHISLWETTVPLSADFVV